MTAVASNVGTAEQQPLAASQNYQANTVPKTRAAEATNKRHALLILTPFNQRGCREGNMRDERGRESPAGIAAAIHSALVEARIRRSLAADEEPERP